MNPGTATIRRTLQLPDWTQVGFRHSHQKFRKRYLWNVSAFLLNLVAAMSVRLCLLACCLGVNLFAGCSTIGPSRDRQLLSASQLRSQELLAESRQAQLAHQESAGLASALHQDRGMLLQTLGQLETQLATANSRVGNLMAERDELKMRYAAVLNDNSGDLFFGATAAAPTVPGFVKDDLTGLNKFADNVYFDLGSAELRSEAIPVLQEFAKLATSATADGQRILVVGHTDDQIIRAGTTAMMHPTNWHLSTDRSDQVILELIRLGIPAERIASMGYGEHQPQEASTDDTSRQRNRRVELFLVPESTQFAKWDPVRSLQ